MPNTSGIAGSWFSAFRPANFKPFLTDVASRWANDESKASFWKYAKARSMKWLSDATHFEKFLATEAATAWMGPVGEGIQLNMLHKLGVTGTSTSLKGAQGLAVGALTATAYAGVGLGIYRGVRSALVTEEKEPPRYNAMYSKMHAMNYGQPFFGSGAKTKDILEYGEMALRRLSGASSAKRTVTINPQLGGLPQTLNRDANTHHLIGRAAQDFNARLFRF